MSMRLIFGSRGSSQQEQQEQIGEGFFICCEKDLCIPKFPGQVQDNQQWVISKILCQVCFSAITTRDSNGFRATGR